MDAEEIGAITEFRRVMLAHGLEAVAVLDVDGFAHRFVDRVHQRLLVGGWFSFADGDAGYRHGCSILFEELADRRRNVFDVGFEREMTGVEELDHRTRNIAAEGFRAGRNEEQIVLAPDRKKARPVLPEEGLIKRIAFYAPLIVELQFYLQIGFAGPGEDGGIQCVGFRLDRAWVANALEIG